MGKVLSGFLFAAVIVFAILAPQQVRADDVVVDWSGREIIATHIKKIGGERAIKDIKSYHLVGKYLMPSFGLEGDLEVKYSRPNRMLVKVDMGSFGTQRRGFDGVVAWTMDGQAGAQLLEGDEMRTATRDATTGYNLLPTMQILDGVKLIGEEKFADQMCHHVEVTYDGETYTEFYSDKTGLLMGRVEMFETPQGPAELTITLSDYKEFDGLLIATKLNHEVSGMEWVVNYSSFEANTIEPSVFDLPDEVKSLVE